LQSEDHQQERRTGKLKATSAITLLALSCLVTIAVFPAHALLPETNPDLVVRLVDPGLPPLEAELVNPQDLVFKQYNIWNGTTYNATVHIEDLDAGWALTNANFTLSYDAALTNLVSTAFDPAWAGTADNTSPGMIQFDASTSASLSGDVLVLSHLQHNGTAHLPTASLRIQGYLLP
jgi:hypothetical protein